MSQYGTPLAGRTTLFVELLPFLEQENTQRKWDYNDYRNNIAGGAMPRRPRSLRSCMPVGPPA